MSVDLKGLSKIIALCRKTGVSSLEVDGIKLTLSPSLPMKRSNKKTNDEPKVEKVFSDEDALFWSSPTLGAN
jgi:hypothetical protein